MKATRHIGAASLIPARGERDDVTVFNVTQALCFCFGRRLLTCRPSLSLGACNYFCIFLRSFASQLLHERQGLHLLLLAALLSTPPHPSPPPSAVPSPADISRVRECRASAATTAAIAQRERAWVSGSSIIVGPLRRGWGAASQPQREPRLGSILHQCLKLSPTLSTFYLHFRF